MNCYVPISDLKTALAITATTDDVVLRNIADSASRMIDRFTGRVFYVTSATKYFDGRTPLWIPDCLSITTLKTDEDGDATFENTFAETDYILYGPGEDDALNRYPRIRIELSMDSDYGGFATGVKKGVQIIGTWGYGDGISATPYLVDTTLSAAISSTSATTCAVTAATNLSAGQTILIDSEQMFIQSISTTTLTVVRGVNGTTAATHSNGASLYIYQYPFDVWQACLALASAVYQNRSKQGLSSETLGDYSYTLGKQQVNTICNDYISSYRILRV
ncbi:MAG: hypothetical protein PHI12_08850 [Dehalococcoidales bacterium]|nr:hypothetical protein [Dehalococcoidales bacterium]